MKSKKTEVKPFTNIPVGEKFHRALEVLTEKVQIASAAFHKASMMTRDANKELFNAIYEMYPELKEFDLSYNHEHKVITVMAKKIKGKFDLVEEINTLNRLDKPKK